MPAKRLPWVKLWISDIDREPFASLTDGEYRTWCYLLIRAATQRVHGRFASVLHAARVTNRPLLHIANLMRAGLLVEHDDGLWISRWKVRQASGRPPIPARIRMLVIARDGLRCGICGRDVDPDDVDLDHVIPLSRGGETHEDNLRVTHSRCNRRRGNRV